MFPLVDDNWWALSIKIQMENHFNIILMNFYPKLID